MVYISRNELLGHKSSKTTRKEGKKEMGGSFRGMYIRNTEDIQELVGIPMVKFVKEVKLGI